jgi:hypothetical protein
MKAALPFALVALLAARPARADVGPESEWYFLAGVNLGAVIEEAVAEFALGAEVSAARLFRRGAWYGVYADTLRDFRRDATRVSAGVEAGYRLAGLDLGPVVEFGDETRTGLRVRAVLTGAWVTLYGGPVIRLGDLGGDQRLTGEVGFLIKVPLPLQGGRLSPVR